MKTASASALLALAASVNAHLFISSPAPIAGSAPKDPLDASGANFPCHGVTLPGSGGVQMPVGSSQLLAFDTGNSYNTAVHGGGSCQISITYETDPAKIKDPNNWHVLYSILGGCPTNSPMNLDGQFPGVSQSYTGAFDCTDPNTNGYDCVNQFNFSIPQGVQNGQATLAWTWFNNIGNREFYMNCVAVDITGGQSDASQMSQFPAMFVANLASINGGQCKTTEAEAVDFPNPGAYTTTKKFSTRIPVSTAKDYPLVVPSNCGAVVQATGQVQTTPAGSAPTSSANQNNGANNAGPSTMATSSATSAPAQSNTSPVTIPAASPTGAPPAASAPAGTGSCAAGSVSCATSGSLVCIDSTHFGICDGSCAVSQAVADGTICSNGAITWASTGMRRRKAAKVTKALGAY